MVKDLPADAGDTGLIPGLGRSPGEGNGNPFQYCCLGNPVDRGTWWATVHGVTRVGGYHTAVNINNWIKYMSKMQCLEKNKKGNFFGAFLSL